MTTRANAILAQIKDPETRISVPFVVTDWSQVTSIELSDLVQVKLPTYTEDAYVEGIMLYIPRSGENPICTLQTSVKR